MSPVRSTIASLLHWLAALVLAVLPFVVALDYGGVLWWTQYVAALAIVAAAALAAIGVFLTPKSFGLREHALLIPLSVWAAYAWFQTIPLPGSVVDWLSPASSAAYTEWIAPFVGSEGIPSQYSISLVPFDSRHAAAMLTLVCVLAWTAATVFRTRGRIVLLLIVMAVSGSVISAIGILNLMAPGLLPIQISPDTPGAHFATFINRNNAALFLNLGLAASFGLLSWRLTALTGAEVDDESFEFSELVSLISDRESLIGFVGAVLCLSGFLVSGSRSGVCAVVIGLLFAFGWVRRRRGIVSLPVIVCAIGICVAVMLIPANLSLESIRRMEILSNQNQSTLLRDGRIEHWPDGLRTGLAHLPAGSGLATYAYAYLPHQQTSPAAWFQHADNLWIELVAEQGIPGVILVIILVLLIVSRLISMSESPDPIDQGLRITGWFALGAILSSQFFDFGLIVPANLLLVTVLFSAISSRESTLGITPIPESDARLTSQVPTTITLIHRISGLGRRGLVSDTFRNAIVLCVAFATLAVSVVVMPSLRADAEVELICRQFDVAWSETKSSEEELTSWEQRLTPMVGGRTRPRVARRLTDVAFQIARVEETLASKPRNMEEATAAYRKTAPGVRRTLPAGGLLNRGSQEHHAALPSGYEHALGFNLSCLSSNPLNPESRVWEIYLDFLHEHPERRLAALNQLSTFFGNDPERLLQLGSLALDGGDDELGICLLNRALRISPAYTGRVVELVPQESGNNLIDILPEQNTVYLIAARMELRAESPRIDFLVKALEVIDCQLCKSNQDQAICEKLVADVAYELDRFELAFANYEAAANRAPDDVGLRLWWIQRLREQDEFVRARIEARRARERFSNRADQFDKIIAAIGIQELNRPRGLGERSE